jgi:hypothetical protein
MFRALNQNEMLCVNGGFYYVPVYDIYKYYRRVGNRTVYLGRDKKFVRTEQVASGSGITELTRYIYKRYV